ncbi:MAG: right-handed parallel beta-helix repeat-containing protein [Chitinophagales bacterium]|nr:right-handed parallel beta-helix repeat-containing protein [Chitinophagales bacterium]
MKHFDKLLFTLLFLAFGVAVQAQPLNGTYTVYGSSPDYANLQAAANDLNSKGVSGPVTFKVRPGTWTSSSASDASIISVSGASATNTITFESENGNAATTTIYNTNTSTSSSSNYIFYFNNAKYVRVRNLTLRRGSASYGNVLRFSGAAQYNIIENCIMTVPTTTSSSTNGAIIYATSGSNINYNIIRNNNISGGAYTAYWRGSSSSSSSLSKYNEISGNTITNPGYYCIYSYYTLDFKVKDNIINKTTSGTHYTFYTYYADGAFEFSGNKVDINRTSSSSTTYGFRFYYCDGTSSNRGKIDNNEFTAKTRGSIYNYIYYSNYYSFSGNKIYDYTTSGSVYPLYNYNNSTSRGKQVYINNNDIYSRGTSTTYLYTHYSGNNLGNTFNNNKVTIARASSLYMYTNYSSNTNLQTNNNTFDITSTSTFYWYNGYSSSDQTEFNGNKVTVNNGSTNYYYWNYSSCDNTELNNNDVTVNGNGTKYFRMHYSSCINPLISGNSFTINGSSSSQYMYLVNSYPQNAKILNNKIDMNGTTGSKYFYAGYYPQNNLEFSGNDIAIDGRGYIYSYIGMYSNNNTGYSKAYNNKIWCKNTNNRAVYNYLFYQARKAEIVGNDIHCENSGSTVYGAYAYAYSSGSGPWIVKDNKIVAISNGSGTVYGFYNFYSQGLQMSNNSFYARSNSTHVAYYGGYHYANKGGADVYNNSFAVEGSGSGYGCYLYEYGGSYKVNQMRNNVFYQSGGGYPAYFGQPDNYSNFDYNNFFGTGTLLYFGYTGQSYGTIASMRAALGNNKNSLKYNPGFTNVSQGDLTPNPANPNSWSLNGRGVQIAGNDKDMNGNARALTTIQGVPDIGAYEFVPTSTPPNCAASPAAPAPSTTQVFTFGEDTAAVIKWGSSVPTGMTYKQYTGTNPPGILAINPTQMFYYGAIGGTGTSLDYELDMYYKDPWIGTIASESALRLAEKVGTNAWVGYSPAVSSSNVSRNFINTPGVNDVNSLVTGIDVKDNASVDAIIEPTPPFCPGTYTVKILVKNNGNNKINNVKIAWELDGVSKGTINHTTPIDINGSTAGNEVTITLGSVTFGNAARKIKAWTFEPNGNTDPVPADDTIDIDYRASLSGTYTVGGTSPDFATPVDAVDALNKYGTCGDVVFDIRPGSYNGKLILNNPVSATPTPGRITFRSENGNASSVTITHNTTSSDMDVIRMLDADNITFKNLTVSTAASYGQCFSLYGKTDNDSIVGCHLNASNATTTSYNSAIYGYGYQTDFDGENLVIKDNVIKGGYYSVWLYNYNSYTDGLIIDGNSITDFYYMGAYIYYTNGLQFTNNMIDAGTTGNYTFYCYYAYQSPVVTGNEMISQRGYGVYMYRPQGSSSNRGKFANNAISVIPGNTAYYGVRMYYSTYMDFMHNSINFTNSYSSGYGAYLYYSSSSYNNNRFMNNVFANTGGGMAVYFYNSASNNKFDYNNIYATGSNLASYNNSAKKSLAAFRTATGDNEHSLSYEPGFISATNLRPDKNDPSSWSLNGRAIQISGDVKDADGNARVDTRAAGVPDIGAYEFEPEVMPPLATATPATPVAGGTQVFTFGELEVAKVTWDNEFPLTAPLAVRQYSGRKGPGVASQVSPKGSMFFYTDVQQQGTGTTYKFDVEVDYMDIWLGDIATESDLRLGFKYSSTYPWMVYNSPMSTVNTGTNKLNNNISLHHFGAYTGLEEGSALSAFVIPQGSIVICTGNNVQLNAEPQNGTSYQWKRNGVDIPGAKGLSYVAGQPGDYSVVITYGSQQVEAVPVTVSTIAAPNALVSANGPLTYCVGNGLTLDAGNAAGVKYQWQLNGNNIPGATNSTYPVNQPGNYTVVVSNIGCSSSSTSSVIKSGPLNVNLGNDTSYCEVKGVYAKLDAGFPGAKYLWSTGATTRTIDVKQAGDYWVAVDGGPNCQDVDTISVHIDLLPKANGISYVKNGNTYYFSPSGPIGAQGYLWLFSDGTTSTKQSVTKVIDGDLFVKLVMFNACGSDTVQLGWPLSVEQVATEDQVSVYPNPAKDRVTISVTGAVLEEVEILNSVGAVIYKGQADKGQAAHEINVSSYANGHYLIRAKTDGGTISKGFDIMK